MEFASWTRDEQKSRLKAWNAKAAKQLQATCQPRCPDTMRTGSAEAIPAYLNNDAVEIAPKVADAPLTSVAAIQASYKSRSKSDEAKRVAHVKRMPTYQSWERRRREGMHRGGRERHEDAARVDADPTENASAPPDAIRALPSNDTDNNGGIWFRNLSYAAITHDPASKQHVLGQMRAALVQGDVVHLETDAEATGDALSDSRLLLQQLTIACLLFCDRTQDLVPRTQGTTVSMTLVPKTRS
ncbi:hypothetical protein H310_10536 [Aphanomyces invadans]|uniref:Uncharacterized protein n=1 Tax=Aphanomyces invadans TaxID=157072 RepID=A0A024TQU2_9STRA|nr:hypothetical protein H310_10536 [Aphanomyces invadans]ETV96383.1 hypothetical protein H310_10536 [Aphanomyces invadans]RHY34820.1 hypothetical protein DYB32_000624 [Aphanomyces invadans]|eukprot:XP_008875175.1 hypothetical protein H310_10536 [Aphanomyces invadans]